MKLAILLAALALTACQREAISTTTTTSATYVAENDRAITKLVNARCDRALECHDIGTDYADRASCARDVGRSTSASLGAEECPGGVNGNDLDACLLEVRSARCNSPRDTLDRYASCRKLCVR